MKDFFKNHKKGCLLTATTLCIVVILGIYLYALFLPGYHYLDAFLFKENDGRFAGADEYASYQVTVERTTNNATITFAVNELVHRYQITGTATGQDVYIYEDGERIFHGQALSSDDSSYWLISEDNSVFDGVLIIGNNQSPDLEELFPSASWLYNVAVSDKNDTFGNPVYLIAIIILAIYLILDIKYPKLFFYLQYHLAVSGGEPSDWYYSSQMIGRFLIIIAIPVCMLISLFG